MGKKKKKLAIETTAVVNSLAIGAHRDKISFTALSLTGDENEVITDMVKNERDVLLSLCLEGDADPNFPDIQVRGKLKGFKINKTCDAPDVTSIQFSQTQVAQITGYIRAEHIIVLKFIEAEPELDFEESE